MNKIITACIVLYKNDINELKNVINSIVNSKVKIDLILIDNSPTNELEILKTDNIEYLHNPSNPGFGASHNIAIKNSFARNSDYHLVLNPDIYFTEDTIEKLVEFMDSNEDVGHIMPKILYPDGDFQYLCKKNPTIFDLFVRGFMPSFLKKILKKRIDQFTYKEHNFDEIIYNIPYLSGCFMMFRTSTLKDVGFFDDKIFMYLEDADITRRFLEVSKTVYYPFATVYHHYAGLTHKKFKYKWITIKSAFIYFNKWGWIKNIY
jgi:GT2 family glycosyltransferase